MPYPVVPETITVHLGQPNAAAANVEVPFAEYIKNVASSEIYPTWPENALRANIYAQISYALNRVFTEYYRSRGYDFDITSSTRYDQAYVQGRDIFENISRIVDEIFNDYIVRQGSIEPLFAQFCDGIRTTCGGLSQWGSVDLAQNGLTPYEILQYYYGDDINIVFNAPVGGVSPSYGGTPLRRGDFGEDVRIIQNQLNRIGKNFPAIPRITAVNGEFSAETEAAVRAFQRIFDLVQDGIVGKATWYKIKEIFNGVKKLSDITSEGLTISEAQRVYPRVLQLGDSGLGVRTVQYYLALLGYIWTQLTPISITGTFDEATRNAVLTFQQRSGLKVDGIVGRETWNALQRAYDATLANLPADYQAFAEDIYPGRFFALGDSGAEVRKIQEYLVVISQSDTAVPMVEVTGTFDTATENAVKALQRQLGYPPNGVVGPILWSEIVSRGRGY